MQTEEVLGLVAELEDRKKKIWVLGWFLADPLGRREAEIRRREAEVRSKTARVIRRGEVRRLASWLRDEVRRVCGWSDEGDEETMVPEGYWAAPEEVKDLFAAGTAFCLEMRRVMVEIGGDEGRFGEGFLERVKEVLKELPALDVREMAK